MNGKNHYQLRVTTSDIGSGGLTAVRSVLSTHLVRPIKKPYTQTRVRWYAELCLRLVEGRERCGVLKVGLVLRSLSSFVQSSSSGFLPRRSLVTHIAARKKPHTLKHTSAVCVLTSTANFGSPVVRCCWLSTFVQSSSSGFPPALVRQFTRTLRHCNPHLDFF